jgi:glycosyltransferase involved in cell wall biosynthesis
VITPAKDEEKYIERTIGSMLQQTIQPKMWVIVDDGSCDNTLKIVRRYAEKFDWILPIAVLRGGDRRPGSAEISAFYAGYELVRKEECEFLVKLDADLKLPIDYFERMLKEFDIDPSLGIASGVYVEERKGARYLVKMPSYHASGASKIVRLKCFVDIGGFPRLPGWDTADEIKAQARGWRTRSFVDIRFHHLRPEGSAIGSLKTCVDHGRMYHACGGGMPFLLLKVMCRMVLGKPALAGGIALLWGYIVAAIKRQPRLVSESEASLYRKLLAERLTCRITRMCLFWKVV